MADTVQVTLDRDRMYRAKQEDRQAITVKKGVATDVPRWVAEAWGIVEKTEKTPYLEGRAPQPEIEPRMGFAPPDPGKPVEPTEEPLDGQPWARYDEMTVNEILDRLERTDVSLRAKVYQYETSHKARKTILSGFEGIDA